MNQNKNKLSYKHRVRSELKRKVLEYLVNNSCESCGESDPVVLEFDHLDREDKSGTISRMVNDCKDWSVIQEEINKCRVLCANCHKRWTAEQLGFWKYM